VRQPHGDGSFDQIGSSAYKRPFRKLATVKLNALIRHFSLDHRVYGFAAHWTAARISRVVVEEHLCRASFTN
jgi:hypothetical protein